MIEKLKSRKLWATVGVAAFTAFATQLGVSEDTINNIIALAMVYIGGQAAVDSVEKFKK